MAEFKYNEGNAIRHRTFSELISCLTVIASYILECEKNRKSCSLNDFVQAQTALIVRYTNYGEDPSLVWPLRFGKVAKQLNVELVSNYPQSASTSRD